MIGMTEDLIWYARQKLVRRYGVTSASSVIIIIIAPLSTVFLFTSTFAQFIKTPTVADVQKARIHNILDATQRPCVLRFAEPTKICGNMRHEHVSYVLPGHASNCPSAVTHYMAQGDDPCGLPDGLIVE